MSLVYVPSRDNVDALPILVFYRSQVVLQWWLSRYRSADRWKEGEKISILGGQTPP